MHIATELNAKSMSGNRLKNIMVLLLSLFPVESQAMDRQCRKATFPSCNNNSVLRVIKSPQQYQVILLATEWQCYNDFCLVNDQSTGRKTSSAMRLVELASNFSHQEAMVKVYREYIHARLGTAFCLIGIGVV